MLTLGVVATSRKPAEHRLPLHPRHLERIDPEIRRQITLERGYGQRFGVSDEELAPLVGGMAAREELSTCDVVLLPKPYPDDLEPLSSGQIAWGWPHLVQDAAMTQVAIDHGLTVIAWETMNTWSATGAYENHVFVANNVIAGYAAVLHALTLTGAAGPYGRRRRAAVISYGATGRGAVIALQALGISDITLITQRPPAQVDFPTEVRPCTFNRVGDTASATVGDRPISEVLAEHDIVVNCILQDTDAPLVFVSDDEAAAFPRGTVVIDVSCDEGMGFAWAKPTSFADPIFTVGDNIRYYAVDHTPSLLWDTATWEISDALIPFLPVVLAGPDAWDANETVHRAIEIRDGRIQNPRILSFQNRAPEHPHPVRG